MSDASHAIRSPPSLGPRPVSAGLLMAGLCLPPLAWAIHLVVGYAVASEVCFPGAAPRLHGPGLLRTGLIVVDLVAIAACVVAGLLSWRSWGAAHEAFEPAERTIDTGEGRSHFLAIWGMLIAALFGLAVVFDFVGVMVLPLCG